MREFVDKSWITFFGDVDVRAPGVRIVTDAPGLAGYRGIYLLRIGDGCTIGAPPDVDVRTALGMDPDEVFTREAAAELVGPLAGLVLGPSWHGYADESSFVPADPCDARRVDEPPDDFRKAIPDEEWSEGGFAHWPDVAYGCFDAGELVCMGNMTDFAGQPADVGLVTHPAHRGKGHGTRLASAMMTDAFESIPVLRYRALFTNVASLAVARHLGFTGDGANIAVRLRED